MIVSIFCKYESVTDTTPFLLDSYLAVAREQPILI